MRHAVYFAPAADHPLWRAGCEWLGRDVDGVGAGRPARAGVTSPWRYGFHATLKAPMPLAEGTSLEDWREALRHLASTHAGFPMPRLEVGELAGFLALRPAEAPPAASPLRRLADDCVESLDRWRAPPTEAERQRHLEAGLSARQREQVLRLGYPHVLDDWRFHMTLSDDLAARDPAAFARCRDEAQRHFAAALAQPLSCDALCWFVEPAPGAPFALRERFPLAR